MRTLFAVTVLSLVGSLAATAPAHAQREGPWCAHVGIGDDSYIERCDMLSYDMCRAEIFAQGGAYCTQNPRYKANASAPAKTKRKAKRSKTKR